MARVSDDTGSTRAGVTRSSRRAGCPGPTVRPSGRGIPLPNEVRPDALVGIDRYRHPRMRDEVLAAVAARPAIESPPGLLCVGAYAQPWRLSRPARRRRWSVVAGMLADERRLRGQLEQPIDEVTG
jgi:hypothetical protein